MWQDDGHEDDDYSSGAAWEDDGHDDDGSWGDDGYDDDEGANYYNDVCFHKGKVITCSGAPEGDAIHVEFSYSVETSGVDPEDTVSPLEGAILDATVDYVSSLDESYHGVTRVSSDPADYITGKQQEAHVYAIHFLVSLTLVPHLTKMKRYAHPSTVAMSAQLSRVR